jgi:hypothetical protein
MNIVNKIGLPSIPDGMFALFVGRFNSVTYIFQIPNLLRQESTLTTGFNSNPIARKRGPILILAGFGTMMKLLGSKLRMLVKRWLWTRYMMRWLQISRQMVSTKHL